MDAAVPAGYYAPNSGGTPELAYEHLKKLTGGKTEIWMYAWVPGSVDDFTSQNRSTQTYFTLSGFLDGAAHK